MLKKISTALVWLLAPMLNGMNNFTPSEEYIIKTLIELADPLFTKHNYLNIEQDIVLLMGALGVTVALKLPFDEYIACNILYNQLIAEAAARLMHCTKRTVITYALCCLAVEATQESVFAKVQNSTSFSPDIKRRLLFLREIIVHIKSRQSITRAALEPLLEDDLLLESLLLFETAPNFSKGIKILKSYLACLAISRQASKALQQLLEHGLNTTFTDSISGDTLLHLAVRHAHEETMLLLIATSNHTNTRNNAGLTPLHEAIRMQNYRAIKTLLDNGADATLPAYLSSHALDFARMFTNNKNIIQLLEDHFRYLRL